MMENVADALLEKIPSYRELSSICSRDCGENLVKLETNSSLYINNLSPEMRPYTGDDIYVRKKLTEMLVKAGELISSILPGYILQIHSGYRHPDIQKANFENFLLKIKDDTKIVDKMQYAHTFVAEPSVAAHPTGGAVDVAIVRIDDKSLLDMGTNPREFTEKTFTFYPYISKQQWHNRSVLRSVMIRTGFCPYDGEWWHFSYGDREWAYHNGQQAIYEQTNFKSV